MLSSCRYHILDILAMFKSFSVFNYHSISVIYYQWLWCHYCNLLPAKQLAFKAQMMVNIFLNKVLKSENIHIAILNVILLYN